jgi:hypothetical protein
MLLPRPGNITASIEFQDGIFLIYAGKIQTDRFDFGLDFSFFLMADYGQKRLK